MNIIVIRGGVSRPRSFNLRNREVWLPLAACVVGAALLIATAGVAFGVWLGQMPQRQQLVQLQQSAAHNQTELASLRQRHQAGIDGLALRLGELQAQSMRLNALGRRLTQLIQLDANEFDFDQIPARGGPESSVDVPMLGVHSFGTALDSLDQRLSMQQRQLTVLEQFLLNREVSEAHLPAGRPITEGWMSSGYGTRIDPFTGERAWHSGIDFAAHAGTSVFAVAGGVVTWAGDRYGYGKMVEIDHGNGYVTRYAHNRKMLVAVGDVVEKGQLISKMGATGRATAPNLHFEVLRDGKTVNPYRFVRAATN